MVTRTGPRAPLAAAVDARAVAAELVGDGDGATAEGVADADGRRLDEVESGGRALVGLGFERAGVGATIRAGARAGEAAGTVLATGGGGRAIGNPVADGDVETCEAGTGNDVGFEADADADAGVSVEMDAGTLVDKATTAAVTAVDRVAVAAAGVAGVACCLVFCAPMSGM
jgi:hypothetical protein